MNKKIKIENLAKQIRVCKKCRLWKTRVLAVPGEGNPRAKLMFLGESPGRAEDKMGKPFVGPSGKFLDWLFKKNNLERKKFFITSVIKCHPPKNRNPKSDEIALCRDWWRAQIMVIKPEVVVTLGCVALKAVLGQKDLAKCHGKIIVRSGLVYFPTFHPAAGRRFPTVKKKMIEDFFRLNTFLKKLKI